ncbi:hypothetical protein [Cronobacter malonaticus]|uniref:hypothetical protein n=1 Tax=Cronobacter malonaticus TaxID=413503 RepID=UPI002936E6D5|nr:hypothetical protein [Cronobacter malonaticus]
MKLIDLLVQELPKRGGWPEGAVTAYQSIHDGEVYFLKENGEYAEESNGGRKWYFEIARDRGEKHTVTREQYEAALAAAQQPVWNGEGLPPVGCECEFFDCEKWFKVTMMYGGSQLVVLYDHDNQIERSFSTSRIDGKFRPIRSEEDRKRDEVIESILDILNDYDFEMVNFRGDQRCIAADIFERITAGMIPHTRIE